jgi:hypothetical protein
MKTWITYWTGLAMLAGLTPGLWAQVPTPPVPPVPGGLPAAVPGAPAAPAAAAPGGLCQFLGLSSAQLDACKQRLCQTPMGQLLNNSFKPIGVLTGGILGNCCPPVNNADLAKPADSAEGAAARVKADEAGAAARRAAVRYLGTVDCNWWGPEVEPALISALRKDRNECVRMEAAWALTRGCCCTKATIAALAETVNGGRRLGPPEHSERVKEAASVALARCLNCFPEAPLSAPTPPTPPSPEKPSGGERPRTELGVPGGMSITEFYHQVEATPMTELVAEGRRALNNYRHEPSPLVLHTMVHSERSLSALWSGAKESKVSATDAGQEAMVASLGQPTKEPSRSLMPTASQPIVDAAPTVVQTSYSPAASNSHVRSTKVQEWTTILNTSRFAQMREVAAKNLATCDWQENHTAVQALLNAAYKDSSSSVRVACIRSLVKMNAGIPPVVDTLRVLKVDGDASVRDEARQAMVRLAPGQN